MRFSSLPQSARVVLRGTIGSFTGPRGPDHEAKPPAGYPPARTSRRIQARMRSSWCHSPAAPSCSFISNRSPTNYPSMGPPSTRNHRKGLPRPRPVAAFLPTDGALACRGPAFFDLYSGDRPSGTTRFPSADPRPHRSQCAIGRQGSRFSGRVFNSGPTRRQDLRGPPFLGAVLVGLPAWPRPRPPSSAPAQAHRPRRFIRVLLLSLGKHARVAHEGEDHGDPKPATPLRRAAASSRSVCLTHDFSCEIQFQRYSVVLRPSSRRAAYHRRFHRLPVASCPTQLHRIRGRRPWRPSGAAARRFPALCTPVTGAMCLAYLRPAAAIDRGPTCASTMETSTSNLLDRPNAGLRVYETCRPNGAVRAPQLEDTRLGASRASSKLASLDNVPRDPGSACSPPSPASSRTARRLPEQIAQTQRRHLPHRRSVRLWTNLGFDASAATEDAVPPAVNSTAKNFRLPIADRASRTAANTIRSFAIERTWWVCGSAVRDRDS